MKHIVFMSLTDNTEQSYLLTDITCLNLLTTYRKREYSQKPINKATASPLILGDG